MCEECKKQIAALIAENDRLLKLLERTVDQYVPLTELEGVPGWSRVVELVEVVTERDQLRAEIAGLNTGYEAYERVNAELKAENEALRDYLNLRVSAMPRDRLRETFNAAYYGPRELGSDGEQCRAGVLAVIGAAMGQGEQS